MVFYFTGTGNSLYIAKQLEKDPISIQQAIQEDSLEFTADRIVHQQFFERMSQMPADACPQKAIQLTVPEADPDARYRNEHITLQEIIEANCLIQQ